MLMPETLSEWVALANLFVTAVFAILTFFILLANRATVREMRKQMADQNRPLVVVTPQVRKDAPVIQLLVRNAGRSQAKNLNLRLDRDFFQFGENGESHNLAKQFTFSQPINSLPSMSELLFDLALGSQILGDGANPAVCPPTFTVSVQYEGAGKKEKYSEETQVDLRPYARMSHHQQAPIQVRLVET